MGIRRTSTDKNTLMAPNMFEEVIEAQKLSIIGFYMSSLLSRSVNMQYVTTYNVKKNVNRSVNIENPNELTILAFRPIDMTLKYFF